MEWQGYALLFLNRHSFYSDYALTAVLKKFSALHISGTKYATVTHKVLVNAAFFALSDDNNIIIF